MKSLIKLTLGDFFLGIIGGLFLTFSQRIVFLYSNQTQYFLHGLRLYDPSFVPQDWFTWKVFHHDFAFGYLLYFLQKIGPLYIMAITTQVLVMILLSLGLLILAKRFSKYPLLLYLLLLTWIRLASSAEIGLGGQYLISGYLQPSEIAGSLMVLGLAFLLGRRYFWSGAILGLAGLFHGAYLLSFGLTILITALAVGFWQNRKSFFSFVLPLGFFWVIFILVVSRAFLNSPSSGPEVMSIMTKFRAPGDYIVSNWSKKWILNWLTWISLGSQALFFISAGKKFRVVRFSFLTALATVTAGVLQTVFFKIESVTAMMLWRVSFWPALLSVLFILEYFINIVIKSVKINTKDKIFIFSFFISLLILASNNWGPFVSRVRFCWLMAIPVAGAGGWMIAQFRKDVFKRSQSCLAIIFIIMMVIMGAFFRGGLKTPPLDNFSHPTPATLAEMEKWAREATPKDSIFVIPPEMQFFRIRARRAVVVDWKLACFLPSDLKEWYQRLCAITGISSNGPFPTLADLVDGYHQLDTTRAKFLQAHYGASYVVISTKEHTGDISGLEERFSNQDYRVLKIFHRNN